MSSQENVRRYHEQEPLKPNSEKVVGMRLLLNKEYWDKDRESLESLTERDVIDYSNPNEVAYLRINEISVVERKHYWENVRSSVPQGERFNTWLSDTAKAFQGTQFSNNEEKKWFYGRFGEQLSKFGGKVDFVDADNFSQSQAEHIYNRYFSDGKSNSFSFIADVLEAAFPDYAFTQENYERYKRCSSYIERIGGIFGEESSGIIEQFTQGQALYELDSKAFLQAVKTAELNERDLERIKWLISDIQSFENNLRSKREAKSQTSRSTSNAETKVFDASTSTGRSEGSKALEATLKDSADDVRTEESELDEQQASGSVGTSGREKMTKTSDDVKTSFQDARETIRSSWSRRKPKVRERGARIWETVQENAPIVRDNVSSTARTVFEKTKDGYTVVQPKISEALKKGKDGVTDIVRQTNERVSESRMRKNNRNQQKEQEFGGIGEQSDQVLSESRKDKSETPINGEVKEKRKEKSERTLILKKGETHQKLEDILRRIENGSRDVLTINIVLPEDKADDATEEVRNIQQKLRERGYHYRHIESGPNNRFKKQVVYKATLTQLEQSEHVQLDDQQPFKLAAD